MHGALKLLASLLVTLVGNGLYMSISGTSETRFVDQGRYRAGPRVTGAETGTGLGPGSQGPRQVPGGGVRGTHGPPPVSLTPSLCVSPGSA